MYVCACVCRHVGACMCSHLCVFGVISDIGPQGIIHISTGLNVLCKVQKQTFGVMFPGSSPYLNEARKIKISTDEM